MSMTKASDIRQAGRLLASLKRETEFLSALIDCVDFDSVDADQTKIEILPRGRDSDVNGFRAYLIECASNKPGQPSLLDVATTLAHPANATDGTSFWLNGLRSVAASKAHDIATQSGSDKVPR